MNDRLPGRLVERLRIDLSQTHRIDGGFSGAAVWSSQTAGGRRAIKRWPTKTSIDRIAEVHRVVRRFDAMPTLDVFGDRTWFVDGQDVYESGLWIEGVPATVNSRRLCQIGAKYLAELHHQSLETFGAKFGSSKTFAHRLQSLDATQKLRTGGEVESLRQHRNPSVRQAGRWIHETLPRHLTTIQPRLAIAANQSYQCIWVLRDIHRQHILFRDNRPVAVIDGDAVSIDSPMVDLARWIGSFALADIVELDHTIETVVAEWRSICPLSLPDDASTAIRTLVLASTWMTFFQWTHWLWVERRRIGVGHQNDVERWQFWASRCGAIDDNPMVLGD